MKNLFIKIKLIIYFLIPILLISIIISSVEKKTNEALNDYSMLPTDTKVIDKIILGRGSWGDNNPFSKYSDHGIHKFFRRGAIELVCTEKKDILLVVKSYLHKYVGPGPSDKASVLISFRVEDGKKKGSLKIKEVEFLSREYFDTIASIPLSQKEITSILEALEERKFNSISFSAFEGVTDFLGNTKTSDAESFINHCQKN